MATTLTRFLAGPFGSQIPCYETRDFYVYLLHFSRPYHHARHYLGVTCDLDGRIERHHNGRGARLMEVVTLAGIDFEICRLWRFESWEEAAAWEKRLKHWQMGPRLCNICQHRPLDVYTAMRRGYWPYHLFGTGKRRPMMAATKNR